MNESIKLGQEPRIVTGVTGAGLSLPWLPALILVGSIGIAAQIYPQVATGQSTDCVITASATVGAWNNPGSHTFANLSEITSIDSLTNMPWWADCSPGRYGFNDNVLWTAGIQFSPFAYGCRATFAVTGLEAGCTPTTGVDVSQVPLFLGGRVDPNILFVIDDSGSMQFEIMPDEYVFWGRANGSATFVYPRASGVYGSSDYTRRVATVDDNNAYAALTRSAQVNTTYYNPSVTYEPWVKADGSSYSPASPSCAWHNPQNTGTCPAGFMNENARDLTVSNSNYGTTYWRNCNSSGSCSSTTSSKDFWPATYFTHNGGSHWVWNNYTKTEIRSTTPTYTGEGREFRTDCAGAVSSPPSCTYAEEIQNFANWYTYYRSRILASRAGIGIAFSQQGSGIRVGFGSINTGSSSVDNVTTNTLLSGVRKFTGSDRADFFDNLYDLVIPAQGTPLRRALDSAGQYYSRSDSRGPWSSEPGDASGFDLTCRRSYAVLMTDGYWNDAAAGTPAARNNNDGTAGATITGPNNQAYTYSAVSPFTDAWSNTLADVAMYYWKNDLRPNLDNEVPVLPENPAFWQHMTTFGVGLGVFGTVDPDDAFDAIDSGATIAWPQPSTTGTTENIDDLLHAAVNSRGGFFSAADPNAFASDLSDVLQRIAAETKAGATAAAVSSVFLRTDTRIYEATFDSADWTGDLRSYIPTVSTANPNTLVRTLEWIAEDEMPAWDARQILSNSGETTGGLNGQGLRFRWNDLTGAQRLALGNDQAVLQYLRGRRDPHPTLGGGEIAFGGAFRDRGGLIGDIVNSTPLFVHKENLRHSDIPGSEGSSYRTFVGGKASRTPMLYVGANAGMLHGFNAVTGAEVFAYVPADVYPKLDVLKDPNYQHKYYVDGDVHVSDAYISGGWKTILLGTTGRGGRSVFALDVTDPSAMGETSGGPSRVLWEFSHPDLGYTIGRPLIARLRDGTWAAVFGNGYGGNSNTASLFVVDLATGALIRKIDTGAGSSASRNGLSGPNFIYTYAENNKYAATFYAGDLLGNVWKFDLDDQSSASWAVGYGQNPLFTARNASDEIQPITVTPSLALHERGGTMVLFGTGKFFSEADPEDVTVQSIYGIWDNGSSRVTATDRSSLQAQSFIYEGMFAGRGVRVVSANVIDWASKRGWYLDLAYPANIHEGERLVQHPEIWFDRLRVTTTIPDDDPCRSGGRGWYMEIDLMTGGRTREAIFDLDRDGTMDVLTIGGQQVPITTFALDNIGVPPAIVGDFIEDFSRVSGLPEPGGRREAWRAIR